jgi:hypothetical protein
MTLANHIGCAMSVGILRARLRRAEDEITELRWRIANQTREIDRWRAAYPDLPPQRIQGVTT